MSKQAEKTEVNKGANKVASGIAKVLGELGKTGNLLAQCASCVTPVYKGEPVPKADIAYIVDAVARQRGWTDKSDQSRKSNVRGIIRTYADIPKAIAAYKKKHKDFTWHTGMKLVTQLKKGKTPLQAVALVDKPAVPKKRDPMQVFEAHVAGIKNVQTRSKKIISFRKDFAELLAKHGL